jgi:hypothetical protein
MHSRQVELHVGLYTSNKMDGSARIFLKASTRQKFVRGLYFSVVDGVACSLKRANTPYIIPNLPIALQLFERQNLNHLTHLT